MKLEFLLLMLLHGRATLAKSASCTSRLTGYAITHSTRGGSGVALHAGQGAREILKQLFNIYSRLG